ncbi:ribosome silencing factor [Oricola sp.]|uniref:ribosome silencing factor n=1 Tax=Oricola sp. TaxID=1979950 RepID=UPI003BAD61CA
MRTTTFKKANEAPSTPGISDQEAADRILELVKDSLEDSKAEDIVSIDIRGKSAMADYMVVASGRSHRHVSAVADQLLRGLKDAGHGTARVEGLSSADWVLIDAGDVIVHVFRPEVRDFYALEKIWQEPETPADTLH